MEIRPFSSGITVLLALSCGKAQAHYRRLSNEDPLFVGDLLDLRLSADSCHSAPSYVNWAKSAAACFGSGVSKPSVNQPQIGASKP